MIYISCDIDGVVNFYPEPWISYAVHRLNLPFAPNSTSQLRDMIGVEAYRRLKHDYRILDTSFKYSAKVREDFLVLYNYAVKDYGALFIFHTDRPLHKYPMMATQTMCWLSANGIRSQGVFRKSAKNIALSKAALHIDDDLQRINTLRNSLPHITFFYLNTFASKAFGAFSGCELVFESINCIKIAENLKMLCNYELFVR